MIFKKRNSDDKSPLIPKEIASGLSQALVVTLGAIITLVAFFTFTYYTANISTTERSRTSQEAGAMIVEGISRLENVMRMITSVISLADEKDKEGVAKQIRRNIPYLSYFDQIIWLYEKSPGNWQFETIASNTDPSFENRYVLKVDKDLITRLVGSKVFEKEGIQTFIDFEGMEYVEQPGNRPTRTRSFALFKTVQTGRSDIGAIIGVSRAGLVFDQNVILGSEVVSRFTIRDMLTDNRIYHMDANIGEGAGKSQSDDNALTYNFSVGNADWQVVLDFQKAKNTQILETIPYFILVMGAILVALITLFIRHSQNQSMRVTNINKALEEKNRELYEEIQERERLNETIITSERDNRAVIDSVSDIIFETDTNGILLFLSAAWEKITGFETERSCGHNLFSMLHPQEQAKQKHDFDLLIAGKKTAYRSFTRIRISDGTFRAIELALSMIRQDENQKLRVVGTITDVEERRRAERALAEAEKKYRTIVENAAGGLYQLTPEGIYLSANPSMARILGYGSPEELLRVVKNANGTVYADTAERENFIKTLMVHEQIFGYENQVTKKDGTKIWVLENVRAVKDESGNLLYFEGSMEDITKRKEADIALMEAKIESDIASRTKTEFIANMSHELRTPLNAIIGFSDIMKNEVMGPLGQEVYKEYVTDIHKSGQGLLKIISEILDISKIEAGKRDLNESEFSFKNVLESCMDLYSARIKEKNIVLINDVKSLPNIIGEEVSIKQVLGNIYANAIKYTPENGRITIFSNEDSDGAFRFSISDTGVGMNADEIRKALTPFGQIDNALDRASSGTGLGLPLAQAVMGIHDGRIDVLSEKSIGTTVTIIFPANRVVRYDVNADNENA